VDGVGVTVYANGNRYHGEFRRIVPADETELGAAAYEDLKGLCVRQGKGKLTLNKFR
jgi:hypothetical protein